jgi:hypothetical protein
MSGWFACVAAATLWSFAGCDRSGPAPAATPAPVKETIAAPQPQPPPFPPPQISGNIPVAIPPFDPSKTPEQARPFFDTFSWQSLVALNWPVTPGQRGVPNQPDNPAIFRQAPNGTPTVWGSYKTTDDLFAQGDARPSPWDSTDTAAPAAKDHPPGTHVFTWVTKSGALSDTKEAFSFPLIDQNLHYVRYEVRYNRAFYDFVRGADGQPKSWLYLLRNLVAVQPVSMPVSAPPATVGATMLKASWREMRQADLDGGRYYVIDAMVQNVGTNTFAQKKMGLVGLHIAQKLTVFPEWIWSTFEQVDNVQRGPGAGPDTRISFNNGTDDPKTKGGWANRPSGVLPETSQIARNPVQVTRFNAIPVTPAGASTQLLNAAWQAALRGTVWQHYELVTTQWPTNPTSFTTMEAGGTYPADSGAPFPENGVTNTTMETYFQDASDAAGAGGNSCMSCHYRAGQSDYSWGLNRRAH